MKKGILLLAFFISNIIFCQGNYKDIITETVSKHDYSKFDSVAKVNGFKGGDSFKVIAQFSVNQYGEIIKISARGPHKIFEEEAIRLVKMLPKLDPPKNLGEGKSIKFTLPITMVIETDAERRKRKKKEERKKKRKKN